MDMKIGRWVYLEVIEQIQKFPIDSIGYITKLKHFKGKCWILNYRLTSSLPAAANLNLEFNNFLWIEVALASSKLTKQAME